MFNPFISAILAMVFVGTGIAAVWLMWDLMGNPRERTVHTRVKKIHRIFGLVFTVIYLVMLFFMLRKIFFYQGEMSARAILHIALGTSLMPLLIFKVLIVRRLTYFSSYLPALGTGILLFALVLVSVTAGRYFLHLPAWKFITVSEFDNDIMSADIGEKFLHAKCQKCHSLERALWANRDQTGWTKTINRMGYHDFPNLTGFEIKQLIYLLSERDKLRDRQASGDSTIHPGKKVVAAKCTACHSPDRIIKAMRTKSETQWIEAIDRMVENSGDADYLSPDQRKLIIGFVLARAVKTAAPQPTPSQETLPEPKAGEVWKYFTQKNDYRKWSQFEGDEGIQPGIAPHGPAHAVYINRQMAASPRNKALHGALVVKESYGRDIKLKNYTVMYKYKGYNPEAGDWFWAKYTPKGKLSDQGKIRFCIDCHAKRDKTDFLFLQLD